MDSQKLTVVFHSPNFQNVEGALKFFFSIEVSSIDGDLTDLVARTPLYGRDETGEPKTATLTLPEELIKKIQKKDGDYEASRRDAGPTYVLLLRVCWLENEKTKEHRKSTANARKLHVGQSKILKIPLITVLSSNMVKPLPLQFVRDVVSKAFLSSKTTRQQLIAKVDVLVVTTNVTPPASPSADAPAENISPLPALSGADADPAATETTGGSTQKGNTGSMHSAGQINAATLPLLQTQTIKDAKVDNRGDIASILTKKLEKLFSSSSLTDVESRPDQQSSSKGPKFSNSLDTITVDVHDLWVALDSSKIYLEWGLLHVQALFLSAEHQATATTLQVSSSPIPNDADSHPKSVFLFEQRLSIVLPPNCLSAGPLPDPLSAPQVILSVFNNNASKVAIFCLPVDRTLWSVDGAPLSLTLHTPLTLQTGHRASCNMRVTLHVNYESAPVRPGMITTSCQLLGLTKGKGVPATLPVAQRYIATVQVAPSLLKWKQIMEPIIAERKRGRLLPFPNPFSLFHAYFDAAGHWVDTTVNENDLALFSYNQNAPKAINSGVTAIGESYAIAMPILSATTTATADNLPAHWRRLIRADRYKLPQRSLASPVTNTPSWSLETQCPLHLHDDYSKDSCLLVAIYRDTPEVSTYVESEDSNVDRVIQNLVAFAYMPLASVVNSRLAAAKSADKNPAENETLSMSLQLRLQFVEPFSALVKQGQTSELGLDVKVSLPSIAQVRWALDSMLPLLPNAQSAAPDQKPLETLDDKSKVLNSLLLSLEERIEATKHLGRSLVEANGEAAKLRLENERLRQEIQRNEAQSLYFTGIAELGLLTKEELEKRYAMLYNKCEGERQRNAQLTQGLTALRNVNIERNELEKQLLKLQQAHLAQQKLLLHLQKNRGKWPGSDEWEALQALLSANYDQLPSLVDQLPNARQRQLLSVYIPQLLLKPAFERVRKDTRALKLGRDESADKPGLQVSKSTLLQSSDSTLDLIVKSLSVEDGEVSQVALSAERDQPVEREPKTFQERLNLAEAKMLELEKQILSQL